MLTKKDRAIEDIRKIHPNFDPADLNQVNNLVEIYLKEKDKNYKFFKDIIIILDGNHPRAKEIAALKDEKGNLLFNDLITENCDELVVRNLIKNGASIEEQDKDGNTPVHSAVYLRDEKKLKVLIENNIYIIDIKNLLGDTPLYVALDLDLYEFTEILLEAGSDPDTKNSKYETAIHAVISKNDEKWVSLILKYKPDLELRDRIGQTSLIKAVSAGYSKINIIKDLISHGANIEALTIPSSLSYSGIWCEDPNDIRYDYGQTSLYLSKSNEQPEAKLFTELLNMGAYVHHNSRLEIYFDSDSIEKKLTCLARFIDIIYNFSMSIYELSLYSIEDLNKLNEIGGDISVLLPRLKHLCQKNGVPQHLLEPQDWQNEVTAWPIIDKFIKEITINKETLIEILEVPIAKIWNRSMPQAFPSTSPYSTLKNIIGKFKCDEKLDITLKSYEKYPDYKPENSINFLNNKGYRKKIIKVMIQENDLFDEILGITQNFILPENIHNSFSKLIKEYNAFAHPIIVELFSDLFKEINDINTKNQNLEDEFSKDSWRSNLRRTRSENDLPNTRQLAYSHNQ